MNAIELIAALKGADEETAAELVERLQCGEIDCSVLPTGKDNAVQQAQIWAQEARTQKGIVEEIGKLVGCANDWETVSAVKAALSGAQQGAAPQPAQVPEGWRLVPVEPTTEMLGEGAIALFAQSREPLSSAYRSMLAAAPRCPMLTAAPSPDHSGDAGKVAFVDGVGAQRMTAEECKEGIEYIIHGDNIYWPLSDDDELRLIQAACGNGEFTYPVATPSVPENEIKAQTLEWFADWLKRQSFAHKKRWTSAANEALRCAARLRTAGDEGEARPTHNGGESNG